MIECNDLAALKAENIANVTAHVLDVGIAGLFFWTTGDFTGKADDANIVKANAESLGTGAWVRQAARSISAQRTGTGATIRTVQDKCAEIISVADYGVSPSATAAENLSGFKLAIAAAPEGAVLDVPPGLHLIDTSGGLATAIEVNKRVTIQLRGDVKATFSNVQDLPPYIFNVTAEGAGIVGPGRVIGDGAINDISTGYETADRCPGLIRLAASHTFVRNVSIVAPPKVGVMVYGSNMCDVSGNRVTGGVTSYFSSAAASQTAHFGIYVAGGSRHNISDNFFYPDINGGMVIQCIFGYWNTSIISRNIAYRPYEKLIYCFGSANIASDNTIIGNTGFVPGTTMEGTVGVVIRFHGSHNRVTDNYIANCGGGIACWDGIGNEIIDNSVIDVPVGIGVIGVESGLSGTRIVGNNIRYKGLLGSVVADGIEVSCRFAAASQQISVHDNVVNGFSRFDPIENIAAWKPNTAYGKISTVKKTGAGNGRIYDPISTGTGGVSGAVEPTWPTNPGDTVVDGTITWVCRAFGTLRDELRVTGNANGRITGSSFSRNILGSSTSRKNITLEYVSDSTVALNELEGDYSHMTEVACANVRWMFNEARGTASKAVSGLSATSVQVDYAEGSFVPALGAAVSTTGTVVASVKWTRNGRDLALHGSIAAATVEIAAAGELITNVPASIAGAIDSAGAIVNANTAGGFVRYDATVPTKLFASAVPTSGKVAFSINLRL